MLLIQPIVHDETNRNVGDDDEARQELLAYSATFEKAVTTKRRKIAQQRVDEFQALEQNVQAAVARTMQLTEQEKDAAKAAIKVPQCVRFWQCAPVDNKTQQHRKICMSSTAISSAWCRNLNRCVCTAPRGHHANHRCRHARACCTSFNDSTLNWKQPQSAKCAACTRCAFAIQHDKHHGVTRYLLPHQANDARCKALQATLTTIADELRDKCKTLVEESKQCVLLTHHCSPYDTRCVHRRLEQVTKLETAHVHKYQRTLAKLTEMFAANPEL